MTKYEVTLEIIDHRSLKPKEILKEITGSLDNLTIRRAEISQTIARCADASGYITKMKKTVE